MGKLWTNAIHSDIKKLKPPSKIICKIVNIIITALAISSTVLVTPAAAQSGSGAVLHNCDFPVYCAVQRGCTTQEAESFECPVGSWWQLEQGVRHVENFDKYPDQTGITIMSGLNPSPAIANDVSALEWTYNSTLGRVHYNGSNVNGHPFSNYGLRVDATNGCVSHVCPAGQWPCPAMYTGSEDDRILNVVSDCDPSVDVTMTFCSG